MGLKQNNLIIIFSLKLYTHRRMSEAFQLNQGYSYPSHTCGPVLVAPPMCKEEVSAGGGSMNGSTSSTLTTSHEEEGVGGRSEALAQRMERKKTREKMRRQEVNDKFNELMDVSD